MRAGEGAAADGTASSGKRPPPFRWYIENREGEMDLGFGVNQPAAEF